jgi:hypothetical protein
MANVMDVLKTIGTTLLGILFVCSMVYLKYRRAKWDNDQKDQKADIQTLFSGKK